MPMYQPKPVEAYQWKGPDAPDIPHWVSRSVYDSDGFACPLTAQELAAGATHVQMESLFCAWVRVGSYLVRGSDGIASAHHPESFEPHHTLVPQ